MITILIGGLLGAFAAAAVVPDPVLEFKVSGKPASRLPLWELRSKLPGRRIAVTSRFSEGIKNYEAFPIQDVLDMAYGGSSWKSAEFTDVAFIALDGYEAVGPLGRLKEEGGFLAFKDLDRAQGWEPVGHRKADPAPFFLVWTSTRQTTENGYPWPWQVAALNLLRFEDQYPAVLPAGAAKDSPAHRGFLIFRERCIRCHAINREGGKIGPDLNEPQSVASYRSKKMLKEFIRNPSKYRHSQMPDHTDLFAGDLEDLYQYFRHKSREKRRADSL